MKNGYMCRLALRPIFLTVSNAQGTAHLSDKLTQEAIKHHFNQHR
jgi:hypothetical protein